MLRATKDKEGFREHIKHEFRKGATLPRTDILRIEYMLRRGHQQLKLLKQPGTRGMGVFEKE